MENALVSLFCIFLILTGTLTVAMNSFSSVDSLSRSWKEMEGQSREIRQTEIATVNATVPDAYLGSRVEITVANEGGMSLADFDRWDVIVRYEEGAVQWLPYGSSTPGWTVGGIFFDGGPEAIEPDILNPTEELLLVLSLNPPVTQGAVNQATISTPRGIVASIMFKWEEP